MLWMCHGADQVEIYWRGWVRLHLPPQGSGCLLMLLIWQIESRWISLCSIHKFFTLEQSKLLITKQWGELLRRFDLLILYADVRANWNYA